MCNIHQHQVLTDVMVRKGSGFVGQHGDDFLTTNDPAWVGFSVEIGPEGGVYILDWHDTDICGNAINFPDSGRIYRIMPAGAEPIARPDLRYASDLGLVALQEHPNDWFVRQARVQLHSRAAAGTLDRAAVHAALDQQFARAPDTGKRLRALWAQHVTGRFDGNGRPTSSPCSRTTTNTSAPGPCNSSARTVTPATMRSVPSSTWRRNDPSPVVRLYLASALQRLEFDQRWPILEALGQHGEDADDHNIPRLLWFALEPMVPAHPAKSLDLAVHSRIPMLQEHVARRMVSGSLAGTPDPAARAAAWTRTLQRVAPGFAARNVGEGGVAALASFRNEPAVQTHPKDQNTPCALVRDLDVPAGSTTTLRIRASYHPHGDWQLRVLANKLVLADHLVSSSHRRRRMARPRRRPDPLRRPPRHLTVENRANNWMNEFGYWSAVRVVSE